MNSTQIFITILIGMSLLACQPKPSSDADTQPIDATAAMKPPSVAELEKQVLALHDSVMPAMSDLMKLKKSVKKQLAELDKLPVSVDARQRKEQGLIVKAALDQADQSMINWMHDYNGDTLAKLNEQQAIAYLKDQQQHVNAMSQLMRKSITKAEAYLK